MRNNSIYFFSMISLLLVSLSVASAAGFDFSIVNDLPANVDPSSAYSLKVRFNNTNDVFSEVTLSFRGSDFNLPSNNTINYNEVKDYSLTLNVPSSAENSISRTLYVDVYNGSNKVETKSVVFDANILDTFCGDIGLTDTGDLKISNFDIINSGRGEDDQWELLDNIEIEVNVENTDKDNSVRDVVVEIKILDSNGNDVTSDFNFEDDKIDLGRINDDDEEVVTFVLTEVPVDMDEGDYRIYVVAYSESDDNQCASKSNDFKNFGSSSLYAKVSVNRDYDRGIIVKNDLKMDTTCGQTVEIPLELYNIGSEKEEKVLVSIYNSDLKIDEKIIIDDFRSGKKRDLTFRYEMPEVLTKNVYNIKVVTYYDWDNNEDELDLDAYNENSEDDLDENYGIRLDILSCTQVPDNSLVKPIINAELVTEDVLVGTNVVIKATVTNPSNTAQEYVLSVNGYNSWATLVGVNPSVLTIPAGETKETLVTFNPTESGVQTFNVRVVGAGSDVSQDVSLNVGESESKLFNFGSLAGNSSLLYVAAIALVILIVLLIIIILVVAIRRR